MLKKKMSEKDMLFFSNLNKKKIKKGPILRVKLKKSHKIPTSNSMKNFNRNSFQLKIPQTITKAESNPFKKDLNRNQFQKYNSSTFFPRKEINNDNKNKLNEQMNPVNNNTEKLHSGKKSELNKDKKEFNEENKIKNINDKKEQDLYCINCLNKKMNLKKNLGRLMKRNNSYDFTFQDNLSLNQLDEEYINNKVIQNEKRQLAAYNQLKKYREKNPKSKKDKLQDLYENSEYPFHGLNLQEYLYYNNKKRNENINKIILDNIQSYDFTQPRKEIRDYYNKVMFQTPLLERDSRPDNKYKTKYIETLQKQIEEKNRLKNNLKKEEQKKEKEELKKYNELSLKMENEKRYKRIMKEKVITENNLRLSNLKKEQDELKRNETLRSYKDKVRKFKERQNEYKAFINQQRMNEMNNLQNWINESLKQKKEKINKKENEDERWKKYHKQFNESYNDNIHADKCAECNLIKTNGLYPIKIS